MVDIQMIPGMTPDEEHVLVNIPPGEIARRVRLRWGQLHPGELWPGLFRAMQILTFEYNGTEIEVMSVTRLGESA